MALRSGETHRHSRPARHLHASLSARPDNQSISWHRWKRFTAWLTRAPRGVHRAGKRAEPLGRFSTTGREARCWWRATHARDAPAGSEYARSAQHQKREGGSSSPPGTGQEQREHGGGAARGQRRLPSAQALLEGRERASSCRTAWAIRRLPTSLRRVPTGLGGDVFHPGGDGASYGRSSRQAAGSPRHFSQQK